MPPKFSRLFLLLLGSLFLLNLFQSYFTELIYDEAYYWYYAKNLDWGYFDHPPMVAFMIKLGGILFDGELGVRFVGCVFSAATYLVLWNLADHPKKNDHVSYFFLLVFSMPLMNVYGFLTLPDTPLLFFTALFLWLYKLYLKQPSLWLAMLIGIVIALLMYSKYHAFLVVFFVVLSNMRLIKDWRAWTAVLVALACYAPHLAWLHQNDFVPIKFHLYERPNQAYYFASFTLAYFVNLIAVFGLLFYWVYLSLIKTRTTDPFTRSLKVLTHGVIVFFFISSFNRRVQAQWVIVISIPLIVLTFNYLIENIKMRKWVYRLGLASFAILLYGRAWLVQGSLLPILFESHGNKTWAKELSSEAEGVPIVFENSYRRASMYEFYSGNPSFTLNNHMYRKSQYSIDRSEEEMRNRRILYVTPYRDSGDIKYPQPDGTMLFGIFMDNFESYRKLQCLVDTTSQKGRYRLNLYNPYDFDVPLSKLKFSMAFLNAHKQVGESVSLDVENPNIESTSVASKDTLKLFFKLPRPKMENPRYFRAGISENNLPPGLNGRPIKIEE